MGRCLKRNARSDKTYVRLSFLAIAAMTVVLTLVACATRPIPGTTWEEPVELWFNKENLQQVRVHLSCGVLRENGNYSLRYDSFCREIFSQLENMGMEVTRDEVTGFEDFQVLYLSTGQGSRGCGFFQSLALGLTLGLIPCHSYSWNDSEVRILDNRGVLRDKRVIRENFRTTNGLTALALNFRGKPSREQREAKRRLIQFIKNAVYTQHIRQQTAAAAENP